VVFLRPRVPPGVAAVHWLRDTASASWKLQEEAAWRFSIRCDDANNEWRFGMRT
jgi:hypothetical protein